jgi:dolichol-phosphate mannosyltransferase
MPSELREPGPPAEFDLEVLLPVHNEAETIEATIGEMYAEFSRLVRVRFIVCEDGSTDRTREALARLQSAVPAKMILSEARKGYSKAVRDGMRAAEAPYLLCLDSDGQCDPKDFARFWEARGEADVVIGWRIRRADPALRRVLSAIFYRIYQAVYRVPVHDPSCPYVLARKSVVDALVAELGEMQEGFWWEFTARVHRRGFTIKELPVHHRLRAGGTTRVYTLRKMPAIGYSHLRALFRIWRQTRARSQPRLDLDGPKIRQP